MLVLSRYPNEWIHIVCPNGEVIKICYIESRDKLKIRLGFDAPEDYKILREEIVSKFSQEAEDG